jgi:hypothetical protein
VWNLAVLKNDDFVIKIFFNCGVEPKNYINIIKKALQDEKQRALEVVLENCSNPKEMLTSTIQQYFYMTPQEYCDKNKEREIVNVVSQYI